MAGHGASRTGDGGSAASGQARTIKFDTGLIADWTSGSWTGLRPPAELGGFSFDARTLRPGECFVALSAGARDGHGFVAQAIEAGAVAALVERAQDLAIPQLVVDDSLRALGRIGAAVRERFSGPVVGVTGSCGKTSTKEMLRLLLGATTTHATPGNWNNRIGVPMTLAGLSPEWHEQAVIEAGINEPGEMALLGAMIQADLVILTHIGAAHLEGLGSEAGIASEKAQLAVHARPDAPLILPADCLRFEAFALLKSRIIALVGEGDTPPSGIRDFACFSVNTSDNGHSTIRIRDAEGLVAEFKVASVSPGICRNAALAVLAARLLRVPDGQIRSRLAEWLPALDRGTVEQRGDQFIYNDSYNANPASMADALQTFAGTAPGSMPRLYVLGAMEELGPEGPRLHLEAGKRIALRACDRVLLVGPEPLAEAYREGILAAGGLAAQVASTEKTADFHSEVAEFKGAVFLKGSRRYALESLLDPPSRS